MRLRFAPDLLYVTAAAALAPPLRARQTRVPVALTQRVPAPSVHPPDVRAPTLALRAAATGRPGRGRARPYVVGGALVGAAATAAAIAIGISASGKECLCHPIAFAPAVAGGAAVGALAGWAIYRLR